MENVYTPKLTSQYPVVALWYHQGHSEFHVQFYLNRNLRPQSVSQALLPLGITWISGQAV